MSAQPNHARSLNHTDRMLVDIKELKLLGDFSHPNIVRFVRLYLSTAFSAPLMDSLQLGVSIPINTRETPVMIISELCSNGDLFDYIRASPVPAVRRMVCPSDRETCSSPL